MGNGKERGDDGGSVFVLLSILVLIVGIVAAAGMVMAVLNYTRESDTPINITVERFGSGPDDYDSVNGGGRKEEYGQEDYSWRKSDDNTHYDTRIWSIRVRSYDNRMAYVDRKSRQLRGYLVDLINAVCQLAGKSCVMVYDDGLNCWDNDYPQIGLMGKWYDACTAYSATSHRIRALKFSEPFSQPARPVFLTRPGNPGGFDPDNLQNAKIGFLKGWWADRFCIFNILDYDLKDEQVFEYDDLDDIVRALVDTREIDALCISNELSPANDGSLEVVRELEPCLLGGNSLMMRKDSFMKTWWDDAFERIRNSKINRDLCRDLDDPNVHGSQPGKSADEFCV